MMAALFKPGHLINRLPKVRGSYSADVPLAKYTWFKVGGPAEVVYRPADADDLVNFLLNKPKDVPVTVIGVGSNLLVRDGGISGVVIRLGKGFAKIELEGDVIRAGSGALDILVSRRAAEANLTGLEFLSGIPGSIGGALRMNAGAYGQEMKDVTINAMAVDLQGNLHGLTNEELGFSYRHSEIPEDWIFTEVRLQAKPGNTNTIAARMAEIKAYREDSQPVRAP